VNRKRRRNTWGASNDSAKQSTIESDLNPDWLELSDLGFG
jgi:hypothetical protein